MKPPSREQCLEWAKEAAQSKEFPDYEDSTEALIHRAYKEGAEAMREEAEDLCEEYGSVAAAARAIRNLKVEDV